MNFIIADTFIDSLARLTAHQRDINQGILAEFRITDTRTHNHAMTEPQQFLVYQSEDGSTRINMIL